MLKAEHYIEQLGLEPHPEGGYFKETYRSDALEKFESHDGVRSVSTAIYFLLTQGNFSAFHRIKSDEMWHHYDGSAIEIFWIDKRGKINTITLGKSSEDFQVPQAIIPANSWFASRVEEGGEYALAGCTVAPGFDFQDFEMADRVDLLSKYPHYKEIIRALTR